MSTNTCRRPSLQRRPSLLLVTVRPRQCTPALSTQLAVSKPIFTVVCGPRWSIRTDRLSQLDQPLPSRPSTNIDERRAWRSNLHSASRTLTVPVPRFPPLAVCVRRPSVYAAPSSWPASANVHTCCHEHVQQSIGEDAPKQTNARTPQSLRYVKG